ncbi:MAG: DUF4136 domain-containing protein [Povalibacter sp.]
MRANRRFPVPTQLLVSVAFVASALVSTGCAAAPKVRVDAIEGELPKCQTFSWNPVPTGDAASFTDQRVRDAVMAKLKAKGYTEAADKADCRIAYHLNSQTIEPAKPRVGVGVGGGSGGMGAGIGVTVPIGKSKAGRGTFTLDVIDAKKNAQVWSGSMDATFDAAELSEKEAQKLVDRVLEHYPDRS